MEGSKHLVTKEELIDRLSKRLAEAKGKAAFCRSKVERSDSNFFGDAHAQLAQHEAEAEVAETMLWKLLNPAYYEEKDKSHE